MVALALFTAVAMGLLVYQDLRTTLLILEHNRLTAYANHLAIDLKDCVDSACVDVLAAANHAAVAGIARARMAGGVDSLEGLTEAEWRSRLMNYLTAKLVAKPHYLEFCLIGASDGEREIVCAHSKHADAGILHAGELQWKGDAIKALHSPACRIYISPIKLNREYGFNKTPPGSVLNVAKPVSDLDGRLLGIIVISIDLRSFLSTLRAAVLDGGDIYLVDEFGEHLAREIPPSLGQIWRGAESSVSEARDAAGNLLGIAVAPVQFLHGQRLALLASMPYHSLTVSRASARRSTLIAGLVMAAIAALLALILTYPLIRPIGRTTTMADAEKLRLLSARSDLLIEEERKKIATEIHDRLGGNLVAFKQDLENIRYSLALREDQTGKDDLLAGISEMIDGVVGTIDSVRRISEELRPVELDFLGLVSALRTEAQRFQARTGIRCEFECEREESALAEEPSLAIIRILQEALRNVYLHANTKNVRIKFTEDEQECAIEVRDEGRGIMKEEIDRANCVGLLGMRERAERVGGRFNINGIAGRGTTVTAVIPLKGHRAGQESARFVAASSSLR